MLLKGGFSEQEINDAKNYIKFGENYNKSNLFTKTFNVFENLFKNFSKKIDFFVFSKNKNNWILALTIIMNNFLFLTITALTLIALSFIVHWKIFHYLILLSLGFCLGILNAKIISRLTSKNYKQIISFVLSPLLAMMFIIIYYAVSSKFVEIFGNFKTVTISGSISVLKGAVINPKIASFIFFLFFNLILLTHLLKEKTKVKNYLFYSLAVIYFFVNKVLISAVRLLKI